MAFNLVESLKVDKLIGSGGFSDVYLATTDDGDRFAVKTMCKDTSNLASVENEIAAGCILTHPNLVKYRTHFHDEENYYIVFDYVTGKTVFLK